MYKISTTGLSLTPLFVTTLAVDAAIEPDFYKIKIPSLHSPQMPRLIKGKWKGDDWYLYVARGVTVNQVIPIKSIPLMK